MVGMEASRGERRKPSDVRVPRVTPLLDALAALAPCLACGERPARAHGWCDDCTSRGWQARRDGDVLSLGGYRDGLGELVRAAKFDGAMRVLDVLGAALADGVSTVLADTPRRGSLWLVPVPSHPRRRAARGDDPALRLALAMARRAASAALGRGAGPGRIDVAQALQRRVMGQPQSRLRPSQRVANVANAFALDPRWGARVAGADVVLVDDVLTSGATIRSAAEPLRSAGAIIRLVAVVAVARG